MIQVINRAMDILEMVAQDKSRLYTLNEISGRLNLNKGTCANILKTLVSRGYIEQEGRMTGYRLGSMSYLLTGNYSHKQELMEASAEPMKKLSGELNESCILSVLKDNMRLVLHEVKCNHELQVINKKEKEAYQTSTGRMILACLDPGEQKKFLQNYGLPAPEVWSGIEDEDDFSIELQKIRKKQMAVQISKSQIIGIAVPVYKNDKIIASLGVYLPQSRYTVAAQEIILQKLKETNDIINKNLNEKILAA
jgi:DNA-binding IclR family transcriptional regulator